MHYSLVVSTSKIYSNLCEAESRLEEKQKWNANNSEHDLLLDDRLEVISVRLFIKQTTFNIDIYVILNHNNIRVLKMYIYIIFLDTTVCRN